MSQLHFIDQQQLHYPVQLLCQVLAVVPSRYYAWCRRAMKKAEPAWGRAMVDVFDDHQRRYGTRRLQVELRELGHRVGRQALRTALRRHGRKALQPKAFTPRTTDSTHGKRCAPNLLLDRPKPTQANRLWVIDITYLPLASGQWVYCCAFQDVCTKQVVGLVPPRRHCASAGRHAQGASYYRVAAGIARPATHARADYPLRPRWSVRRQCVQEAPARRPGPALAQPPRRVLR